VWRETAKKRMAAKLQEIKMELKRLASRADSVRWCLAPKGDLGLLPMPRCSR